MSYILDALRKAERERNLGQPPSMQAVTQPSALPRAQRRPPWPLLLAGASLLVIALLAALAWKYYRAANVPAAVEPAPAAALPATPPPSAAVAEPAETVSSFDDLAAAEPAPEATDSEPAAMAAPAVARAQPLPEPVVEEEEPAEEAEEPAAPEIPLVRDMPASWRAGFPQLTIEVHVYDDDPAKRWIMTGGQRYREGSSLPQGPRIVEIAPDGIVFEHQGQRALLPITR